MPKRKRERRREEERGGEGTTPTGRKRGYRKKSKV